MLENMEFDDPTTLNVRDRMRLVLCKDVRQASALLEGPWLWHTAVSGSHYPVVTASTSCADNPYSDWCYLEFLGSKKLSLQRLFAKRTWMKMVSEIWAQSDLRQRHLLARDCRDVYVRHLENTLPKWGHISERLPIVYQGKQWEAIYGPST